MNADGLLVSASLAPLRRLVCGGHVVCGVAGRTREHLGDGGLGFTQEMRRTFLRSASEGSRVSSSEVSLSLRNLASREGDAYRVSPSAAARIRGLSQADTRDGTEERKWAEGRKEK